MILTDWIRYVPISVNHRSFTKDISKVYYTHHLMIHDIGWIHLKGIWSCSWPGYLKGVTCNIMESTCFFFPLPTSLILHLIGPTRVWREPELLRRRWLSNQPAAVLGCDRATTPGFHERLETPNMMVALVSTGDETAWKNMAMFWYLFVRFLGCTTVL